ncbi:MAG: helix-turn-helix transcriptional regulator, partial [Clostridia bacterium]|nr:helix-turn-helix transcriptional regulator [Clostridia bacterium]
MENNYAFGNYITELRKKKKLSQAELGEKLGVSNKAVSKWENG